MYVESNIVDERIEWFSQMLGLAWHLLILPNPHHIYIMILREWIFSQFVRINWFYVCHRGFLIRISNWFPQFPLRNKESIHQTNLYALSFSTICKNPISEINYHHSIKEMVRRQIGNVLHLFWIGTNEVQFSEGGNIFYREYIWLGKSERFCV